ncbi:WD40/YVTN/BNR-like repeat-containing protein [Salinigranum sp. GCM10025319]|uniref:WD40/YVTN/BNR-like repeat-containing protein n=1 Tax=Salinigranum sp. GCM10025319 TaxID=3252687 RepID=UPI00361EF4C5
MDRLYAALPGAVAVVDVDTDTDADPDVDTDADPDVDPTANVVRTTAPHPEASIQCVAASPADPDLVCCGTADHGLFRSTDAGETWRPVERITQDRITSVTCAAVVDESSGPERDGDRVAWWAGTEPSRVYRSDDGGVWTEREGLTDLPSASSWAFPPRPHTHHVRWVEVDAHDPDHLYVAVEAGALVTTHDGGETWEDRVQGSRRDTHSMATHPDAPGRAYCAAGDGYAETGDGGETWDLVQEGLDHRYCWSVVVDPADPDHRLVSAARGAMSAHRAGSADSYVYRKRGEEPWERVEGLPVGTGVTRYVLTVGDGGFYALSNAGLFRSSSGEAWERLPLDVADDATATGLAVVPVA